MRLYLFQNESHSLDLSTLGVKDIRVVNEITQFKEVTINQAEVVEYLESIGYWQQLRDHTTNQRYSPRGIVFIVQPISPDHARSSFVIQNDQQGDPLIAVGTNQEDSIQIIRVGISKEIIEDSNLDGRLETAFWQGIYMALVFGDEADTTAENQINFVKTHKNKIDMFTIVR